MKSFNANLIKQVNKRVRALTPSNRYSIADQVAWVMHAVAYNANHAAYTFGVAPSTVRTLLRSIGLESAINSYHRKPAKAKAKLFKVA